MKKVYFILTSIFTLLCLQVVAQTPYYYNGGVVTNTASWGVNTDGSGANPTNFTNDDQIFNLVNGGGVATLTANWTVSGLNSKIVIGDGVVPFNLSTSTFTVTGLVDISDLGIFTVQSATSPFTVGTLASGSTVDYALDGAQVVRTGTYHHLTLSNATAARAKTATGGTVTVNGTLNITTNNVLTMGTNVLNGTLSSIIGDGSISTLNESAAPIPSGKIWTQTVTYGSSNTQPVSGGTYENLTFSGSTTVKNVGGDITVNNLLNVATGSTMVMSTFVLSGLASPPTGTGSITTTHTATASPIPSGKTWTQTVSYSAAGAQTVRAGTYQNLTISGGGSNIKTADGNISVLTTLTTAASTILDMATFDILTAPTITNGGTIRTQSTSATPIPAGLTLTGTFLYNSTSPQTVVPGSYSTLNTTGGDRTISNLDTFAIVTAWTTGSGAIDLTGTSVALRGGTVALTITGQTAMVFNNLVVSGAGTKTFSNTNANITINGNLNIPGTTTYVLAMGTNKLILGGGHTFSGTGTLTTAHASTTEPIPNGTVWPFIVNYSSASSQSVSTGTYGRLIISGNGNSTANGDITVNDSLAVTAGTLVMGTNLLTGTIAGNGGTGIGGVVSAFITTSNTTATPIPSGRIWPMAVTYNAAANQTVVGGTYGALSLSGGANVIKTAAANISVGTSVTVAASTFLDMSTFTLSAASFANSGTIQTQNTSSTPLSAGLTIAGTVEYNGAGSQTVVHATYTNLNISGGVRDLSGLGDITVAGILTATTGTINGGTSNVRLTGGNVNISLGAAGAFNNFRVVGTGTRTVVAGTGPLTVNGELEVHSVRTLALNDNQLLGTITSNTGTGTITTTRATAALAPGITWTISVSYSGTTQEVSGGTYRRLLLAGTLTKTATGNISVSDTLSIVSPLDMSTFQLTGTITRLLGTATLTTANEDPTAPIPVGKTWLSTTVFYNSANMQTVVNGQYAILDLTGGNRTLSSTDSIKVSGTFNAGAGTYTPGTSNFVLNGTATQSFVGGGQTFHNFNIISGSTKTVSVGGFSLNGTLHITSGATLAMVTFPIGGTPTATSGTGNITTTCATAAVPSGVTWNPSVSYSGTTQELSGGTYRRLLIAGTLIKTATGNVSVSDSFNIGSPVDMTTFQLTGTMTSLVGTATLTTANEDVTAPIPAGKTWLSTTVFYNSANMQTVVNGQYVALNLTGGDRTLSPTDSIKVSGTFTAGSGAYTSAGSTFALNGATTQTFNGGGNTFNNFAIILGTTKTVAVNGFNVDGVLTVNSGSTLAMATFQLGGTISSTSGTGTITTACVATNPLPNGETWSPAVTYNAATQNVANGIYNNTLTIATTGTKTALGNITANGILAVTATLSMGTNLLDGTITSTSGTGTIITQNTTSLPIPEGETWTPNVTYSSTSAQTVVSGTYNLALNVAGGNRTFSNLATITVGGTFTANTGAAVYTTTGTIFNFSATVAQALTIQAGFPFETVLFTGAHTATPSAAMAVATAIQIASGTTVNMGGNALTGATLTAFGTGNLRTQSTSATPIPTGRTWTFRITFDLTNNNQTIPVGTYNGGLYMSATSSVRTRTLAGNITVADTLSIGSTFTTLVLGANTLTLNGIINPAQTGTVTGGLTSNIVIGSGPADAGTLNMTQTNTTTRSLSNLTVSRNTGGTALTLGNEVRLINVLTLTDGTLASNGNLVFVSTGVSTSAQIDVVSGTGAVSGNVVVQRFIDGQPIATNVRWRFLASPVNTSNGIDDNWQQQIFITGTGTGGTLCPTLTPHTNGIDPTPSNSPSFYTRDAATDTWVALANTNATELVTGVGYRVFYRGTRSQGCANVFSDTPPAPVDTTLVATGTLATGTQIIAGSNIASRYSLAGNPFQATIDWESPSIVRSNISSTISTFRPNTTNGAYAYYTVGVGGTNGMTQYMTAGTGFWIQTVSAGLANLAIGEAAKVVSQGGYGFFKTAPLEDKVLRIKLFETGQAEYLDEAIVSERAGSNWAYNAGEEAQKLGFTTGLMQLQVPNASTKYAICVVPGFEGANNRINIDAKTVVGSNYSLNFSGVTSFDPTLGFTLYDTYTGTNQDLRTNAVYNFTTPDAASIAATRFYIIFTPNAVPLPVKMISFKGERTAQNETALNWQTASEEGSDRFEIERSVDAKSFTLIGATKAAKYSSKTVRYAFIDNAPALNEVNYYRLKQYDLNGTFTYTNIVSVSYKKADAQLTSSDIIMYPVPASNTLTVEVKNIDILNNPTLMVYDMFGKELSMPTVYENGKWQIETSALKAGVYFVHINNNGSTTQLKVLKD